MQSNQEIVRLDTPYQEIIYTTRYSRWIPEENRREFWNESVDRYISFMRGEVEDYSSELALDDDFWNELRLGILLHKSMPSMRALMTAGPALERCNVAGFNCSYLPVNTPRAFDECMYILMCGTGVGFSVERQEINQLPTVAEHFEKTDTVIVVKDSKAGWARAFKELIHLLYSGQIPSWDTSKVRPAGARLKTFGGRSSGPEPLEDLFRFTCEVFEAAAGRKLNSLECHDIMCKVGDIVVVGGVRRAALISLSNLSDERMRDAKSGRWYDDNPQRALANNSAAYTEKPDVEIFMKEWLALIQSKSGERGLVNREALVNKVKSIGRDHSHSFGLNPCAEIILRPNQFCNLTEVVLRSHDTFETAKEKVRLAVTLGTFQSLLTDFKYLRKIWQKNTEEERLLGVSLTGILDCPDILDHLAGLREYARDVNKELAEKLGVNQSAAITCVKPSGTVSQLVDSASGIHPRHSDYYIRSIRGDKKDPVTQFMIDKGFVWENERHNPDSTAVFYFPVKSPRGALTRDEVSAIRQLEIWKKVATDWCDHNPSTTISVREEEWFEVGAWVYKNFDILGGVSFLPYSEHTYAQAPYQECTEEEYLELFEKMPKDISWDGLSEYEKEDKTTGSQELACSAGGVCEVVDFGS